MFFDLLDFKCKRIYREEKSIFLNLRHLVLLVGIDTFKIHAIYKNWSSFNEIRLIFF